MPNRSNKSFQLNISVIIWIILIINLQITDNRYLSLIFFLNLQKSCRLIQSLIYLCANCLIILTDIQLLANIWFEWIICCQKIICCTNILKACLIFCVIWIWSDVWIFWIIASYHYICFNCPLNILLNLIINLHLPCFFYECLCYK